MMQSFSSWHSALLAFVTALAGGEEARAASSRSQGNLSGSLGVVTDYVDRGLSQSDGHAAVQGEIVWQHSEGAYASLWASSVDFDDGDEAVAEINYILGLGREIGAAVVDASVAYIHYPGAADELQYDLVEFSASAERSAGPLDLAGHAIFTPENAGNAGQALYVAIEAGRQVIEEVSVAFHVGRQWIEREDIAGPDYNDWGLALEWAREHFSVALRFSDTDAKDACADLCDARVAAGVAVAF